MANVIKPRRRMSDATAPTTANLQDGEMAVNTVSRKIYMRVGGAIVELFKALTKADVGLGNVDNTSDANKPISTATQNALAGKASIGQSVTFVDVTIGRPDGSAAIFFGNVSEYLFKTIGGQFVIGQGGLEHVIWHSGIFSPASKATLGENAQFKDITASGYGGLPSHGVVYLGNGYVYNRGAGYNDMEFYTVSGGYAHLRSSGKIMTADSPTASTRLGVLTANGSRTATQPRVFVQATDPGAEASDGDIWIW